MSEGGEGGPRPSEKGMKYHTSREGENFTQKSKIAQTRPLEIPSQREVDNGLNILEDYANNVIEPRDPLLERGKSLTEKRKSEAKFHRMTEHAFRPAGAEKTKTKDVKHKEKRTSNEDASFPEAPPYARKFENFAQESIGIFMTSGFSAEDLEKNLNPQDIRKAFHENPQAFDLGDLKNIISADAMDEEKAKGKYEDNQEVSDLTDALNTAKHYMEKNKRLLLHNKTIYAVRTNDSWAVHTKKPTSKRNGVTVIPFNSVILGRISKELGKPQVNIDKINEIKDIAERMSQGESVTTVESNRVTIYLQSRREHMKEIAQGVKNTDEKRLTEDVAALLGIYEKLVEKCKIKDSPEDLLAM